MTDELEQRLREHLEARASTIDTTPDPAGLAMHVARTARRRERFLRAGLVACLVIGTIAGFAIRNQIGPDDESARAEVATDGSTTTLPATEVPTIGTGGQAEGSLGAAPVERRAGEMFWATGGHQELGRLFTRSAYDIEIRAYGVSFPAHETGNPLWTPPAHCYPSGSVQAEVSNPGAVGILWSETFEEIRGDVAGQVGTFGVGEGTPGWVAIVQTDAAAELVRVTFADGATDEMVPVDGIAVLAAPATAEAVPPEHEVPTATVEVVGLDVDAVELPAHDGVGIDDQECQPPPPSLPEPGEQPADPGARAAAEQAFEDAFNSRDPEISQHALEDPEAIAGLRDQITAGQYADQAEVSRHVLRELVFAAPDQAWIRYDIVIEDWNNFTDRIGEMILTEDGRWRVTTETVCQDIRLAGVTCPPEE